MLTFTIMKMGILNRQRKLFLPQTSQTQNVMWKFLVVWGRFNAHLCFWDDI